MAEGTVYEREAAFHDAWAALEDVGELDPEAHFTAVTAPENRWLLRRLGRLRGLRVLDLGCGLGENAAFFASRGAEVLTADISPGMVEHALEVCRRRGLERVEGRVLNAMALDLPDASVDVVYCANLLHHLPDPERALREAHRVLRPGGCFCSWDPLVHNPLIAVYRRLASAVRSADERPLELRFVQRARRIFARVEHRCFWYLALWIFLRFYLVERVDPNRDRYWKRIIREHRRLAPTYRSLARWDRVLSRLPGLRAMAWNLAIVAHKAGGPLAGSTSNRFRHLRSQVS